MVNVPIIKIIGEHQKQISNICFDSRKIVKDCIYIAIKGTISDGHNYISESIQKGARVVVCEVLPDINIEGITYIIVDDCSYVLSIMSSNFYDNPSTKLKVIGVTGTNGKTTIATLLYKMFLSFGYSVGLISTIINKINDKEIESSHTTPDSLKLNELLHNMVEIGCEYCFMEVSSHSIVQHRISGIHFEVGVFTNITHDHLDYHKTFDEYLKAKKLFFDNLSKTSFAITNNDDKNGMLMVQNTKAEVKSYSLKSASDFKAKIIEHHFNGMLLSIDGNDVWSRLTGTFNAYNLLAIYSTAKMLGFESVDILRELSLLTPAEGRFDVEVSENNITVIIDYAHTPDALANVLSTINSIRSHNEKLISVVGAGGNRDKTKRSEMALVASDMSDILILTSDNPRDEEPEDIIKDMRQGVPINKSHKLLEVVNRLEAIKTAVMLSQNGDVILIAGKGHEKYQEIKGIKNPFDDKAIVCELLKIKEAI